MESLLMNTRSEMEHRLVLIDHHIAGGEIEWSSIDSNNWQVVEREHVWYFMRDFSCSLRMRRREPENIALMSTDELLEEERRAFDIWLQSCGTRQEQAAFARYVALKGEVIYRQMNAVRG